MSNPYEAPETTGGKSSDWYIISTQSPAELADQVHQFFTNEGYRLESGTTLSGTYGIGSDILRILFGAFVRRYKFAVQIQPEGNGSCLLVEKGMSGIMGGAIGYARMNTELNRIRDGLKAKFA